MQHITLISATNRPNSHTEKIALYYKEQLQLKNVTVNFLSLENLPTDILLSDLYGKRSESFQKIIDDYILNQTKFIFILPEYNGSFPGILKVFLDAIPPRIWLENKACLTGISSGRAGNLRGLEHLTNILGYLKVNVYHHKQPISMVDKLLDGNGHLVDEETKKTIDIQLEGFLKF